MNTPINFIVIDDDKLVNTFCKMLIKKNFTQANVCTFEHPESGLEFIKNQSTITFSEHPTVLFLDINMPIMSGWEFLEAYGKLSENIKSNILIYILSSSVNDCDKLKAKENQDVQDYLVKPLSKDMLNNIAHQVSYSQIA